MTAQEITDAASFECKTIQIAFGTGDPVESVKPMKDLAVDIKRKAEERTEPGVSKILLKIVASITSPLISAPKYSIKKTGLKRARLTADNHNGVVAADVLSSLEKEGTRRMRRV
jgi:hypothetical protein